MFTNEKRRHFLETQQDKLLLHAKYIHSEIILLFTLNYFIITLFLKTCHKRPLKKGDSIR